MSEAPVLSRLPSAGPDIIGRIGRLTIALTESEYHAATILAFDPDAYVSPGHLATEVEEPRDRHLAGDAMDLRAWRLLARACSTEGERLDPATCLATFLAERSVSAEVTPEPEIGGRVRIKARPRVGGDRYAGREGVIVKTHFAGFYVKLDMSPRERSQKTELVETGYLDVLAPAEAA